MIRPLFVMMVGLPYSGKTTTAEFLAKTIYANIINPKADYDYAMILLNDSIAYERNIIWDQTNARPSSRISKLHKIPEYYHKVAYVIRKPFKEILDIYNSEPRNYPKYKLLKMNREFRMPCFEEGFNEIIVVKS